jgi:hypothetical protein
MRHSGSGQRFARTRRRPRATTSDHADAEVEHLAHLVLVDLAVALDEVEDRRPRQRVGSISTPSPRAAPAAGCPAARRR